MMKNTKKVSISNWDNGDKPKVETYKKCNC
jgi:hypothetical protein